MHSGAVTLVNTGAIALGPINTGGDLNVTVASGDITNPGALVVGGNTSMAANQSGASIRLNNPGNLFTGALSISGAGGLANVSVTDTTALDLPALDLSGNLNVTAAGITQSGPLIVAGTAALVAGTGTITLNQAANDFHTVSIASARDVTLVDANALDLGASSIAGNLVVDTGGPITESGALMVSGATTLAAGVEHDITLNNANDLATLGIASARNVTLVDVNALDLASSHVSGSFGVTAGGITQSAAISVAGRTTLDAGSGGIALTNAANDFAGTISLASGGDAALNTAHALDLATSNITGNLTLVAGGSVTDSRPQTVGGTTSITTQASGANIVLDETSQYAGAVSLSVPGSEDIHLTHVSGDLRLGTLRGGEITLSASHSILDGNGPAINITATGGVTLTAGTGTIGAGRDAVQIDAPSVSASAGGAVEDISVNVNGKVTDNTIHESSTPSGLVVLNGAVIGSAPDPADGPALPQVNPVSLLGATVVAVDAPTNANGEIVATPPVSIADSMRLAAYGTDSANGEEISGCDARTEPDFRLGTREFGMKLPVGAQPMMDRQDDLDDARQKTARPSRCDSRVAISGSHSGRARH